jgi:hypothetical protein
VLEHPEEHGRLLLEVVGREHPQPERPDAAPGVGAARTVCTSSTWKRRLHVSLRGRREPRHLEVPPALTSLFVTLSLTWPPRRDSTSYTGHCTSCLPSGASHTFLGIACRPSPCGEWWSWKPEGEEWVAAAGAESMDFYRGLSTYDFYRAVYYFL